MTLICWTCFSWSAWRVRQPVSESHFPQNYSILERGIVFERLCNSHLCYFHECLQAKKIQKCATTFAFRYHGWLRFSTFSYKRVRFKCTSVSSGLNGSFSKPLHKEADLEERLIWGQHCTSPARRSQCCTLLFSWKVSEIDLSNM